VLTTLWGVSIIDNQTDRLVMRDCAFMLYLLYQLQIHSIKQLAPSDIAIIHKAIEHVLFTDKQTAE
jgi:hypothetical protein